MEKRVEVIPGNLRIFGLRLGMRLFLAGLAMSASATFSAVDAWGAGARQIDTSDVASASKVLDAQTELRQLVDGFDLSSSRMVRSGLLQVDSVELQAIVINAGSPLGFTVFSNLRIDATVSSDSHATVSRQRLDDPYFPNPMAHKRWEDMGRPSLANFRGGMTPIRIAVPAGQFSFIREGLPLTYSAVEALPASASSIEAVLSAHLFPYAHGRPGSELILRQVGFLLAQSNLRVQVQRSVWNLVTDLPGVHSCGSGTDAFGRRGIAICATDDGAETELLIGPHDGKVLDIVQRLDGPDRAYPTLPAGAVTASDSFLPVS